MKKFSDILNEARELDKQFKLTPEEKDRLVSLDKRYHLARLSYIRECRRFSRISNQKEAVDLLIEGYNNKVEPTITLEYPESRLSNDDFVEDRVKELKAIKDEFLHFDTYMSQYYIAHINYDMSNLQFINKYTKDQSAMPEEVLRPTKDLYEKACEFLEKYPYEEVDKEDKDYKRDIPAEKSQKTLQDEIDRLGYGWRVELDSDMVPRMCIEYYGVFHISDHNLFSKVDLASLKVHEVRVHVGRKYYGLQKGLYVMMNGLPSQNAINEGLAIYNTLDLKPKTKPNIRYYIAVKTFILYWIYKKPMIEILDMLQRYNDNLRVNALSIIRCMRKHAYTLEQGSSFDADYFEGYNFVKDLSDKDRKELIEWNVGPANIYELDNLKKFFKENKFKAIDPTTIEDQFKDVEKDIDDEEF